ncbi:type II toxin-antitoxin system HicA family toxin [Fervidibacter sacchari]
MSGSELPELSYDELVRLLRRFSLELRERGSILVGRNRFGEPFTVHQHPSEKCYPQKLAKILKHAGISRDEFWEWYRHER